ncbi:MAG: hypothetical protein QOJ50_1904 [Cryptosporangiaceae bacterium]|jgi:hypothetical protein|nr:hypothetical protein [Cryptosporangiaceae bacterium]
MHPIVCAHCHTPSSGTRHGLPWSEPCGIYLTTDEQTGDWVSPAELARRGHTRRSARVIAQTRAAAAQALPAVRAVLPGGWHATVSQLLPGASHAVAVSPPVTGSYSGTTGDAGVTGYLLPPHDGTASWGVEIHNRVTGTSFPLFTGGGARAARYPGPANAAAAAVAEVLIELGTNRDQIRR